MNIKFGLVADEADERDFVFTSSRPKDIPKEYQIKMPNIRDQKDIGSCASFSITTILSKFYNKIITFSPLFVYYNARKNEFGDEGISEDSGNTLRGVLKSINKTGFCEETSWKYNTDNFATTPPIFAYIDGKNKLQDDKILYKRTTNIQDIKEGLCEGFIPYIGIRIYENIFDNYTNSTGNIVAPKGKHLGGHAVVISGYDENGFKIHNSWGDKIGDSGYYYLPYNVFETLIMDCWLVKVIPDEVL